LGIGEVMSFYKLRILSLGAGVQSSTIIPELRLEMVDGKLCMFLADGAGEE